MNQIEALTEQLSAIVIAQRQGFIFYHAIWGVILLGAAVAAILFIKYGKPAEDYSDPLDHTLLSIAVAIFGAGAFVGTVENAYWLMTVISNPKFYALAWALEKLHH